MSIFFKKLIILLPDDINNSDNTKTKIVSGKNNLRLAQNAQNERDKILLLNLVKQKNYNLLKNIIMNNKDIDINKHYFFFLKKKDDHNYFYC